MRNWHPYHMFHISEKVWNQNFQIGVSEVGNEISNIAIIRNLRKKSTSKYKQKIRKYLPRNDYVRNRDLQDPSSLLSLTREPLLNFISSVGATLATLIPEITKFTCGNREKMYKNPYRCLCWVIWLGWYFI